MKKTIALIFLCGVLSFNLYKTFNFLWADFSIIKNYPNLSYDDKMRHKIGSEVYDYILFLKENLPQDAVVLIPPMRFPWPQTGNEYYLNYFLYPRILIHGDKNSLETNKKITYALMLWGESQPIHEFQPGWPKFPVKAEELIFFKEGKREEIRKDYDPKTDMTAGIWGIIKVRED